MTHIILPPTGEDPSPIAALGIVGDLLFWIALPTGLFALGGRWLDRHYNSTPWFTIGGLVLAVVGAASIVSVKAESLRKRLYPNEHPDRR